MKKRMMILMSVVTITGSLFVNLLITDQADTSGLVFENIEALAEKESGLQDNAICVEAGVVCIGFNKGDKIGIYPGLSEVRK